MKLNKLLHHIGIAAGLVGLGAWYLLADRLGILAWVVNLAPVGYEGAGLMAAVMLVMTPAFLIWKYLNRWLERTLRITGRYYEDEYYGKQTQPATESDRSGKPKPP